MSVELEHEEVEEGEELWIVSYADMMTLLFGFFVILYSFSTLDDKKFDQMTENMAVAFKSDVDRKVNDTKPAESTEDRRLRALQMLVSMLNLGTNVDDAVSRIERSYAEGKVAEGAEAVMAEKVAGRSKELGARVEDGAGGDGYRTVELILPATTLFPSGGYALSKSAVARLRSLAADLRHVGGLTEIEIVGHTDGEPPGRNAGYDSNFTLSSLRAGAVASTLIRFGVDERRVSVRGMGSLKPILPERDAAGRAIPANMAKNRRVVILLKMRRADVPNAH